jgi:hypothetical protein
MPPYVTNQQLAERYGGCSVRKIQRMQKDGRLPPPEYPTGPDRALNDLEKVEATERAAIERPAPRGFYGRTKTAA